MQGWLTGWKDISKHIGRSERTAKKYVRRYGMPVRRTPGGQAFALRAEIDRWAILFDETKKKIKPSRKIPDNFIKKSPR